MMKRQPGFTLIELMITVAIIAILASIAFPGYDYAMRKSRRGTAQAFMMDIAQREQALLLDRRSYAVGTTALTTLGLATPGEITGFYSFAVTDDGVATGPPDYIITATAAGKQDVRNDEDLRMRNDGYKARGDAAGSTWYPAKW